MRRQALLALALTSALAAPAYAQAPQVEDALDGVDTVVLIQQGKEVFGKSALSVVRGGYRYLFSTVETKAAFEQQPEKFEIQLGGLCARMGKTTYGNPSNYAVHEGRIYLFGSDDCRKRFLATPEKYLEKPRPAMPTAAAAVAAGRAVLDRIVASHGGAAQFDALSTYRERTSQVQKRPNGEVPVTLTTAWRFPGEARQERTMVFPNMPAPVNVSTVLTPDGAWGVAPQRVMPARPSMLPSIQLDLLRHPLAVIKLGREPGVAMAAMDQATVDGTTVERVRIVRGGLDVVLAADEKSGRLHSIEFQDRNMEGQPGTYTILYSDLREVNGVLVPHAMRALFDGQPDAFQTWTIEALEVNPTLDPALFERPKGKP